MAEFFDYDPLTGITYEFDTDDDLNVTLYAKQDLQPVLDWTSRMRNLGAVDKGIKEDWWRYAVIPPVVMLEMINEGIDFRDSAAVYRKINQDYPYLKLTDKHHEVRGQE